MANNWDESFPDLINHSFEIYDNCTDAPDMTQFHMHDFYEIRFIIHGNVTHYSENAVHNLGDGCITVIPPGHFHRVTPRKESSEKQSTNKYERILLYLSPKFLCSLNSEAFKLSEVFDVFGGSVLNHLSVNPAELPEFTQPLREIVRKNADDAPLYHISNSAVVVLVLASLAERILSHRKLDLKLKSGEGALVPDVISYINSNLSENLSLDSLSEKFFVSKFYLSHQFKQYTQLSLHQYVLTRRMMHAKFLLSSGKSPSETAKACGYHEYSSFYKAFLRETGQSPCNFK